LRKWLAWIPGEDGVDMSAPWSSVEGLDIIPDWRGREVSGALGGNEDRSRVFFPLDIAAGVEAGLSELQTHVEATASGT
jgi:hypothetical protein